MQGQQMRERHVAVIRFLAPDHKANDRDSQESTEYPDTRLTLPGWTLIELHAEERSNGTCVIEARFELVQQLTFLDGCQLVKDSATIRTGWELLAVRVSDAARVQEQTRGP